MWQFVQEQMPGVPESLLQEACKEGHLNGDLFSAPNYVQVGTEFSKVFPCIKTSVTSEQDNVVLSRFLAGVSQNNPPDVITLGSETTMKSDLADKGLLLKYVPTSANDVHSGDPGYFYSFQINTNAISFNTQKISPSLMAGIKNWSDVTQLLGPQFKGQKLGMGQPSSPSAGGSYLTPYVLKEKIGQDNVTKLLSYLNLTIYSGSGAGTQALTSGEISIWMGNDLSVLDAAAKGAPVQVIYPEPRVVTYPAMGIAAKAPDVAAAKLFVEFNLSKYGQALYPKLFANAPIRDDVPDTRPGAQLPFFVAPDKQTLYSVTSEDLTSNFDTVVAPYKKYGG